MNDMISAKIDVGKIDKTGLYDGQKGKYLNVTLIPVKESKHGEDWFIVQDIGQERRQAGERGPILGNARRVKPRRESGGGAQARVENRAEPTDDGLPF
jgi:hypothetical protein